MSESTTRLKQGPLVPVKTLRVEVLKGPDRGRVVETSEEVLSIGSAEGNTLKLTDDTVSRFHLELARAQDGVRLSDLGSSNGTLLGSARIERGVVPPGVELSLGHTRIVVRDGSGAAVELYAESE